jgi:hypothetical protein
MADGFPKLEEKNKKQSFIFRFPKFNGSVVYDPAFDMFDPAGSNGAGPIANMLNVLLAALTLTFASLLA